MAVEDLRASSTPFSLSFSGSGFLALYQVGVVQSLLELAPELLKSACKVYGSSAGSLIAAAVVCGVGLGKEPTAPPGALLSHKPRGVPLGADGVVGLLELSWLCKEALQKPEVLPPLAGSAVQFWEV